MQKFTQKIGLLENIAERFYEGHSESNIPMGKNFQNRHMTVKFFMQSVPILTPTGVKKQLFYDNFKNCL